MKEGHQLRRRYSSLSITTACVMYSSASFRSSACVSGSAGLPELARLLADRRGQKKAWTRLEAKYPTSGLAILQTENDWAEAHPGTAVLSDFVVPRGSD